MFEGLDATGKSTQAKLFEDREDCITVHMPSSAPGVGREIYAITENYKEELSPLARQYLHLACHTQIYADLVAPAIWIGNKAVIMDRNWWSSVAYGYFGSNDFQDMSLDQYMDWCKRPAMDCSEPDIVFLFLNTYEDDPHNTEAIEAGYTKLASLEIEKYPVVVPPLGTVEATHDFIMHMLVHYKIAKDV